MLIHYTTIDTPVGKCTLGAIDRSICWVSLNDCNRRFLSFVENYNNALKSNKYAYAMDLIAYNNNINVQDLIKNGLKPEEDNSHFNDILPLLDNYFNGEIVNFSTIKTIYLTGTAFQQSVWNALKLINYGKTISYGELAQSAGKPGAFRAAGTANGNNLIPLIIPCHRVIKSDGSIGGYSGGVDIKRKLLTIEGVILN